MAASADFTINGTAVATGSVNVGVAATITLSLVSTDGVRSVVYTVVGTDESGGTYTVTPGANFTATLTSGAAKTALLIRCQVNGGVETSSTGVTSAGNLVKTGKSYVTTEYGVVGEGLESSPTYGWAKWLNPLLKAGGGGGAVSSVTSGGSGSPNITCAPTTGAVIVDISASPSFATSCTSPSFRTAAGAMVVSAFTGVETHQKNGTTARTDTLDPVGASTITWVAGVTSLTDSIAQSSTGVGVLRSTYGQQGLAGNAGGVYKFGGGAGGTSATNLAGATQIDLGTKLTSNSTSALFSLLASGTSVVDVGNVVPSWLGATATAIVMTAQGNIGGVESSGHMYLRASAGFQLWLAANSHIEYDSVLNSRRTVTRAAAYTDILDVSCTSFTLKQADNTTNSATAAAWIIQAPNATGLTANGGTCSISSGTGTNSAGLLNLQCGGVTKIQLTPTGATLVGGISCFSLLSPTALGAGPTANYNPTGLAAGVSRIRQDMSASGTISGLSAPTTDGTEIRFFNINAGAFTITLTHDDAGSAAANRFFLKGSASAVIPINGSITLSYDSTSSRWREVGRSI